MEVLIREAAERRFTRRAMHTWIGDRIKPHPRLLIDVFHIDEMQPCPEVALHIAHAAFDLPFRLGAIRLVRTRCEPQRQRKIQIARIEVNGAIGTPFNHRTFQVVMEHFTRHTTKVLKRVLMTAYETPRVPLGREFHVHRPRPA